jgi:hypothetical protein
LGVSSARAGAAAVVLVSAAFARWRATLGGGRWRADNFGSDRV